MFKEIPLRRKNSSEEFDIESVKKSLKANKGDKEGSEKGTPQFERVSKNRKSLF